MERREIARYTVIVYDNGDMEKFRVKSGTEVDIEAQSQYDIKISSRLVTILAIIRNTVDLDRSDIKKFNKNFSAVLHKVATDRQMTISSVYTTLRGIWQIDATGKVVKGIHIQYLRYVIYRLPVSMKEIERMLILTATSGKGDDNPMLLSGREKCDLTYVKYHINNINKVINRDK